MVGDFHVVAGAIGENLIEGEEVEGAVKVELVGGAEALVSPEGDACSSWGWGEVVGVGWVVG